ncbi:substrate-binding periplasmic protein [Aliikangiella marina]|uniref:substrate-binding periplasmic protein n=1 Tax=Aliikangiella marina TaxID=1712262 RepID=UPI00163DB177|nr:transporter substrate-binding domain-containing protein [Aliikangiella marina]
MRLLFSILFYCFLAIVLPSPSASGKPFSANSPQPQNCQLKYGWNQWPPLQYVNNNQEVKGIQIEFVKAIVESLGCELTLVERSWNEVINGIENGDIDFTANASVTTARKSYAYFSLPYRKDLFSIWVKREDKALYSRNTLAEFKQTKVKLGLIKNQYYGPLVESLKSDPSFSQNITLFDTNNALLASFINSEIDAMIEDPFVMAYRKRVEKIDSHLSRVPIDFLGSEVGFMFSKKTTTAEFVNRFNLKMRELKDSNVFQSIWLDPELVDKF